MAVNVQQKPSRALLRAYAPTGSLPLYHQQKDCTLLACNLFHAFHVTVCLTPRGRVTVEDVRLVGCGRGGEMQD